MSGITFVIIKPDAVQRKIVGEIISRFEKKGFEIIQIKYSIMTPEEAEELYLPHKEKIFYKNLCQWMTKGLSLPMIIESRDCYDEIETVSFGREVVDQIRKEFATGVQKNCVHASSDVSEVTRESNIFFAYE